MKKAVYSEQNTSSIGGQLLREVAQSAFCEDLTPAIA